MSFSESDASTVTNIDTEDATVRAVMIQNHQGYIAVKENAVHVFWSDGLHYYIVSTNGIGEDVKCTPCQGQIFATMDNESVLSKAANLLRG